MGWVGVDFKFVRSSIGEPDFETLGKGWVMHFCAFTSATYADFFACFILKFKLLQH